MVSSLMLGSATVVGCSASESNPLLDFRIWRPDTLLPQLPLLATQLIPCSPATWSNWKVYILTPEATFCQ